MKWNNIIFLLIPAITQAIVILRDDGGGGGNGVLESASQSKETTRRNSSKPLESKKKTRKLTIRAKKAKVKLSGETSVESLRHEIKKKGIEVARVNESEWLSRLDLSKVGDDELAWLPVEFYQHCTQGQVKQIIEGHKYNWLNRLSEAKVKALFANGGSNILQTLNHAEDLKSSYWAHFDLTESLARFGPKLSVKQIYHLFHLHTLDPYSHFAKSVAHSIHGCIRTGQYQFIVSNFDAMREMQPTPQAILDRVDTFSAAYSLSPERFCRPSPTTLSLEEQFSGGDSPGSVGEEEKSPQREDNNDDTHQQQRTKSAPKPIPHSTPLYSHHHQTSSYPNEASVAYSRKSNYDQFVHSSYSSYDDSASSNLDSDDDDEYSNSNSRAEDSGNDADSSERSSRHNGKYKVTTTATRQDPKKPKPASLDLSTKKRKNSFSLPSPSFQAKQVKKPISKSKDKVAARGSDTKKSPKASAKKSDRGDNKVDRQERAHKQDKADKAEKPDKEKQEKEKQEKKSRKDSLSPADQLAESLRNLQISAPSPSGQVTKMKMEKRTLSTSETESA